MDIAYPDKMRLLNFATGTNLLDVGCGSGDFLAHAMQSGFNAYGIDPSQESVARTGGRIGTDRVDLAYANDLVPINGRPLYDTIVMSSVLHEVFSYGNDDHKIGKLTSLVAAIKSAHDALVPGGTLIIRDGIRPQGWWDRMLVDDADAVEKFIVESPFGSSGYLGVDRRINLSARGTDKATGMSEWSGYSSSLMEFAFTYVWGPDSFEREVQEYYGIFDKNEYKQFVERRGFKMIHFEQYIQQGYVDNLAGKVEFMNKFPNTNAIWVYERV